MDLTNFIDPDLYNVDADRPTPDELFQREQLHRGMAMWLAAHADAGGQPQPDFLAAAEDHLLVAAMMLEMGMGSPWARFQVSAGLRERGIFGEAFTRDIQPLSPADSAPLWWRYSDRPPYRAEDPRQRMAALRATAERNARELREQAEQEAPNGPNE